MKTLAIIVNYHASDFIGKSVDSVLNSRSMGPLQVVVVDNSQDPEETAKLRHALARCREVDLIVSSENLGFGRACNMAFDRHDGDMVLLLNPDAVLLPGCLLRLQQALIQHDGVGAVGPQIFWDDDLQYHLPPSYPDLFLWIHPIFSVLRSRFLSDCWRFFSLRVWRASRPVRVLNLSGGHVLIKREAAIAAGGLFDPAFFLYYEDTDLFVRIRQAGYALKVIPGAKVVHYYDQCDQKNWKMKRQLMVAAHHQYIKKHGKGWKRFMYDIARRITPGNNRTPLPEDMACYDAAFALKIPKPLRKGWLFEWSPNSDFIPAIGKFGTGPELIFPEKMWQLLAPGRYYGRIGKSIGFVNPYQRFSWVIDESENGK